MNMAFDWKYKLGEIKIIDAQNNLQYSLIVGYVDYDDLNYLNDIKDIKDIKETLYIRIYDDYDLVLGCWVDSIEKGTSETVKRVIKEQRLSSEVIKQCADYARRMEAVKAFS
jgi:hypothetical protein